MDSSAKKALGVTAILAIGYWIFRPRVVVKSVQLDGVNKTVQYYMNYHGKEITDTFKLGDSPQFVPVGDGVHFFGAWGNNLLGTVDLHIGYFEPNGGFKTIKGLVIGFNPAIQVT